MAAELGFTEVDSAVKLSICITNWNAMATSPIVLTHIEALFREFELEHEALAFRQPSADDLAKFLKSWAQKHHLVRIINSASDINKGHSGAVPDEAAAQNVGQCVSRNRMFQASRGHFILFLDCDIVPIPHSIGYMLEYLQCRSGVGGVHYEVKTETFRLSAPELVLLIGFTYLVL